MSKYRELYNSIQEEIRMLERLKTLTKQQEERLLELKRMLRNTPPPKPFPTFFND